MRDSRFRRASLCAVVATAALLTTGCLESTPPPSWDGIPPPEAWRDFGPIFARGEVGDWDRYLEGGFTSTLVKKDGRYFLYYQGSPSYRVAFDETVCGRAVGVAVSQDGVRFEKHSGNPVVTWSPTQECEEGAAAAAAVVVEDDVVLFYGANTAKNSYQVHSDIRYARSGDGLEFVDEGISIRREDPTRWGSGDEMFPLAATLDEGGWRIYYVPNGTPQRRLLGAAWGGELSDPERTAGVTDPDGEAVRVWGSASHVRLRDGRRVLFVLDNTVDRMNAWRVDEGQPSQLVELLGSFEIDGVAHVIVHLDLDLATWFMYTHVGDEYRVRLAPEGDPDGSGPAPPASVSAQRFAGNVVELSWSAAEDPETGVAAYAVYRNGNFVAQVVDTSFRDAVEPVQLHSYEVAGINFHGTEGERSAAIDSPPLTPSE